ncbi:22365_t:CDS:2 [Cetraspora pellucida]|uniref:22365_t:CDS:1 n=1 Tax=Cetraspora pellucida TaxID=1433469 RepID=A0A9N9IKC0_9GLOM|nr:22365_t:CDS:2 [Cetraspora pellucida]
MSIEKPFRLQTIGDHEGVERYYLRSLQCPYRYRHVVISMVIPTKHEQDKLLRKYSFSHYIKMSRVYQPIKSNHESRPFSEFRYLLKLQRLHLSPDVFPFAFSRGFTGSSGSSIFRPSPALGLAFRHLHKTTPVQNNMDEYNKILNIQRAARPISPHMTIYQPQITWYMSGFHRITGGALATALYGGAIAYAIQGQLGLGLNSDALIAEIATLPASLKFAGKFALAFPFTFHTFNGVRHLIWDTGSALTLKGVYATGYTVLGLSAISTLGLCMI